MLKIFEKIIKKEVQKMEGKIVNIFVIMLLTVSILTVAANIPQEPNTRNNWTAKPKLEPYAPTIYAAKIPKEIKSRMKSNV